MEAVGQIILMDHGNLLHDVRPSMDRFAFLRVSWDKPPDVSLSFQCNLDNIFFEGPYVVQYTHTAAKVYEN